MFLFEVGGGKFGDVNSLLQLFICVRSKLEDISILVLLCLNTYTTKSCECRAGRGFFRTSSLSSKPESVFHRDIFHVNIKSTLRSVSRNVNLSRLSGETVWPNKK